MNEQLPSGASPIEATPATENVLDLKSAIEKSKNEIAAAETAPVKRGRGRPRKNAAPTPSVESSAAGAPSVETPKQDFTVILAQALKMPFEIAATRSGCKEVALTDDEVKGPAEIANELFNAYMPELAAQDPKKVLAWTFAASLAMLAYSKFNVYQSAIASPQQPAAEVSDNSIDALNKAHDRQREFESSRSQSAAGPASPAGFPVEQNIPAHDLFRRRETPIFAAHS